jgi:hypothetical protein
MDQTDLAITPVGRKPFLLRHDFSASAQTSVVEHIDFRFARSYIEKKRAVIQQRATRAGFVAALALCTLALPIAHEAGAKTRGRIVDCHVESAGKIELKGKCLFTREKGGSFALENVNRDKPLFGEILVVSVSIVSASVAEVRGLTIRGNNSRWGPARRSSSDNACWQGSDFKVCAR